MSPTQVEAFALPNGLEVLVQENHSAPLVAVSVMYRVGSANEGEGQSGFAHLFEHLMFEATAHIDATTHQRLPETLGGGQAAFTYRDHTIYYAVVPSNHLASLFWMYSDRMGFFLGTFDDDVLKVNKDVVRNERRMRYENAAYGPSDVELNRRLFPEPHPYHEGVIGKHADIDAATLDEVARFYRSYYRPNNATLTVVGDVDLDEVRRLAEQYFGPIPSLEGNRPTRVAARAQPPSEEIRATVQEPNAPGLRRSFAWIGPPVGTDDEAALVLAAYALGRGNTSVLHRTTIAREPGADRAECSYERAALGSIFRCDLFAANLDTLDNLEAGLVGSIQQASKEGFSVEDHKRALAIARADAMDEIENFATRANLLNYFRRYFGKGDAYPLLQQRLARSSSESLREAVLRWLASSPPVVVTTTH